MISKASTAHEEILLTGGAVFHSKIITFNAIEVAAAPVVVASLMSVKGQPVIACACALLDGNDRSPAAETAVGEVELRLGHAIRVINAVV